MHRASHDSSDSRPRYPSRRDHSSNPGRDETPLESTAGRSSAPSYDKRYDSRYHYPPSPSTTERARQQQRSPLRKRRSWPPQPFAEDEAASLRRESNARQLMKDAAEHEAPFRGTVDQEPLIIEVPESIAQHERRFVRLDPTSKDTGIPTPPTSEDERVRRTRRRSSKLNVGDNERVPEMARRKASPYAFTKPAEQPRDSVSSDTRRPPRTGSSTSTSASSSAAHKPTSTRRDSARLSGGHHFRGGYNEIDSAIDDTAFEPTQAYTKVPKVTEKQTSESPRISEFDQAGLNGNAPIRKLNLDARRNTDTQNTLPTLGRLGVDKSRRPTPLVISSSLSEAQDVTSIATASLNPKSADAGRSGEPSLASSRRPSPAGSAKLGAASISRSPRRSAEFSKEGSLGGSRPSSATSSRPASPSLRTPTESSRLARTDLDLTASSAANASGRAKPPSRLTAVRRDSESDAFRHGQGEVQRSGLPYPEDSSLMGSGILMPEEQDHAYYPSQKKSPVPSAAHDSSSSASSAAPAPSSTSHISAKSARPVPVRGYSAGYASTADPRSAGSRPRPVDTKRAETFAMTSETRKELAALMGKGLPPCPRPDAVAGFDDWHTVAGAPSNLNFCPDCIGTLFERTIFRQHFRRSLPRNLDDKVRCALGDPWTRLAWLLTLQQHRTDLNLLRDLADIDDTTDPCPGAVESARSWYGLRDLDGLFVRDFHVCYNDVRKIERLLPSLAGMLVKLPYRASYERRTCAIRTDGNRFSAYLDALVSTHEKALASRKGADPMPLIGLVERKTRLRECSRDNMLAGGLWHFIPEVPSLTVCEDCFESIVEPDIKTGSSVAKRFNRTVQPAYGEGMGSSCQLYSRRMRKVFRRAVEENDVRYLMRKAKERREAELWLQERYKDVMRKAQRLNQEGSVSEEEKRRLTRDLEKISTEWTSKWE